MSETHGLDQVLHFHRQVCNDPECELDEEAFSELAQLRDDNARLTTENASLLESFKSEYERAEKISRHEIWYNAEIERLHAALDSQPAILTPRNCETCRRAAEAMREAAASLLDKMSMRYDPLTIEDDLFRESSKRIRAIPLQTFGSEQCADCEPLKPEA